MTMSGLTFLEEIATMNGVSADASLVDEEDRLFNLFFSDGFETGLGLQASGDFPELAPLTEPSDTAEESVARTEEPPPAPQSRRKAPPAGQRALKPTTQSQEKSRWCKTSTEKRNAVGLHCLCVQTLGGLTPLLHDVFGKTSPHVHSRRHHGSVHAPHPSLARHPL